MPGRESNKKSPQSPSDHGLRCPHQQYTGVLLQKRVCIIYFIRSNDSFVKPFSVFLALLVLLSQPCIRQTEMIPASPQKGN